MRSPASWLATRPPRARPPARSSRSHRSPRRQRSAQSRSSEPTVDPGEESASIQIFGLALFDSTAALPLTEARVELCVFFAEPEQADLLVELGVFEGLRQMVHDGVGALLGKLPIGLG